ncbi:hypothetical protein GCM10010172_77290 [Paractinoplanes ferrugineus]|uniref:Uncharacterized protein n=1 Tax=Paractinoplanes ferrugineus TaxID=113564 RepID=A0A919J2N0_9ACTN|nr:DUF6069 family protein [Actinoplanes ferrugineus]GIE12803.1 hypothetical protein Afe05nite_46430 [Actinoplanes ferrugineus]
MPTTTTGPRPRGLARTGLLATLTAMAATTLTAALAHLLGVNFEVPDGGAAIPLPGITVVTAFFSTLGVFIAAALRRWSTRPAERFAWTAASLTGLSLLPPLLVGADPAAAGTLITLHLIAAAVMGPALLRPLVAHAGSPARAA